MARHDADHYSQFLIFSRYCSEEDIPESAGIYCVFSSDEKHVIYIGHSNNMQDAIRLHPLKKQWRYLASDLIFSYSKNRNLSEDKIMRCCAALVFKHQPLANTDFINRFPFGSTEISIPLKSVNLFGKFLIEPTKKREMKVEIITRAVGQTMLIGDDVLVTIKEIKNGQVDIAYAAPEHITIHREEIYDRIQKSRVYIDVETLESD